MSSSDPRAAPKPFVFVLMPFKEDFWDVYELGIKAVAAEAGAVAERVDEQHYREDILDRIANQIAKADVIVADMSGQNPNVFYEVGYAHALNKIVIPLTRDPDDIPFDLKHRPHIVYSNVSELKQGLAPRLAWAIEEARRGQVPAVVCPVDVYINSVLISGGRGVPQIQDTGPNLPNYLQVQIKNVSGVSIKDPITHIYLLLERETIVQPAIATNEEGSVYIAEPGFYHSPPIDDQFVRRFQIPIQPLRLPAYAMEYFWLILTSRQPLPRVHFLNAMLELLVADGVFRFKFQVVYVGGQ